MRLSVDRNSSPTLFHLGYEDDSPDCWRHFEELLSDGGEPVELELYWGDMLSDAVELIEGQGDLLHMIKEVAW